MNKIKYKINSKKKRNVKMVKKFINNLKYWYH